MQAWSIAIAQAAVHFESRAKALRAKRASLRARGKPQRPAGADGITKLPGAVVQVLFENQILAEVPSSVVAAQDQLELHFPLLLLPGNAVAIHEGADTVMAHHFQQPLVAPVDLFNSHV